MNELSFIVPQWPTPTNVKSLVTTRLGGVSVPPFDSFNLGDHVGDLDEHVDKNRHDLYQHVGMEVPWLKQVHGKRIVSIQHRSDALQADGATSDQKKKICAVLTADCLPILMCDASGEQVAAIHGGWRGLASGIIPRAVSAFASSPDDLLVYIGPAISQACFEVGEDVLEAFKLAERERTFSLPVHSLFKPGQTSGKYYADIVELASSELRGLGVKAIYGGNFCSYSDERFYSYRKDGQTGRFASLIWLDD